MWRGELALLTVGAALWIASAQLPATMPVWLPWTFGPAIYAGTAFPTLWYVRGLLGTPRDARPGIGRIVLFALGTGLIWAVLETRYLYLSQHAFFLNRIQHLVMHHLGPFLIALSWPGATLWRGAPPIVRRACTCRPVTAFLVVIQNPVLAGVLFAGLIAFWLEPTIHFPAMLAPPLYALMNWSMILDGLLFWFLVLDPRPMPLARISYPVRLLTVLLVEFPQILIGSRIALSSRDLYPSYDLCGRLFPSLGPIEDQHIGGIIIWIPAAMMSAVAFMLIMNNLRRHEDSLTPFDPGGDIAIGGVLHSSRNWTGR